MSKYELATDEEDLGDEASSFLRPGSKAKTSPKSFQHTTIRTLAFAVLCITISCGSILLYELLDTPFSRRDNTIDLLPARRLLPYFKHNTVVRFEPNNSYYGDDAGKAWAELNAKGGGWITVDNGEQLGLGPPLRYNNKEGYGLSVFHQLHCIESMHENYLQMRKGNVTHMAWHIEHCFDYLRQVVMCHADLALEHRQHWVGEGPDSDGTDGWGALHQCRDWSAVVQFAEQNALTKGWHGHAPHGGHR